MHRGVATSVRAALAIVVCAFTGACGTNSSTPKSTAGPTVTTVTTAKSTRSTTLPTFTIPKATFPAGQDPCKLSDADVSTAAGFAVHRATPPNDRSCLYVASAAVGAPSVYILWNNGTPNSGTETRARSDSMMSLGGRTPASVTELTGFPGWAFTAFQELHDIVDGCAELTGGPYFCTRISIEAPGSGTLPDRSAALLHKLAG